jgi:aminoglycoside phosphotransferase family enzyme
MSVTDELRLLKFSNLYTFHRAAMRFHVDACKASDSLKKQLKENTRK